MPFFEPSKYACNESNNYWCHNLVKVNPIDTLYMNKPRARCRTITATTAETMLVPTVDS